MSEADVSEEVRVDESGRRISVGHELRRAREVRRVTLAQLAAETRIALRHLEALEQDRLDELPGRLYARNFVRTVARSLGADEAELLDYFDYQTGRAEAGPEAEGAERRQAARRRVAVGAFGAAVLVIAAALVFALVRASSDEEAGPAEQPAVRADDAGAPSAPAEVPEAETEPPARPEPEPASATEATARAAAPPPKPEPAPARPAAAEPVRAPAETPRAAASRARERPEPTTSQPEPASPPAAEPVAAARPPEPAVQPPREAPKPRSETPAAQAEAPPRVRLAFSGPSWIEIVPEGSGEQIMGLKTARDEVVFELDSPYEVTVANAGNVELWIDGRPARPLGAPGERRTLRLDARNWRSYLR